MRSFLSASFLILMLLGTLSLSACDGDAREQSVHQLRVDDFRYVQRADGARILRGSLANPTKETLRNVQIEVSLLDADNRRVETARIAVAEVPAEKHTPFRQVIDAEDAVQGVRIRRIRAL